ATDGAGQSGGEPARCRRADGRALVARAAPDRRQSRAARRRRSQPVDIPVDHAQRRQSAEAAVWPRAGEHSVWRPAAEPAHPTRGIDVGARAEIYRIMQELCDLGAALVMTSSDLEEVVGIADIVITMYRGRVVARYQGDDIAMASILADITHPIQSVAWPDILPRAPMLLCGPARVPVPIGLAYSHGCRRSASSSWSQSSSRRPASWPGRASWRCSPRCRSSVAWRSA